MLIFSLLLRLYFLLLPLTVVGRPINPGSFGKALVERGFHDAVEGMRGGVRMLGNANRPVSRRAKDEIAALPAPALDPRGTVTKFEAPTSLTGNPYSNNTILDSAEVEIISFDYKHGPLEVAGTIDLENLDVEIVIYVLNMDAGAFKCNLLKTCEITVDVKLAKGTVKLYLKNKNEIWLFAQLSLPFGKSFHIDKEILVLPNNGALTDGVVNGTAAPEGIPFILPVGGTLNAPVANAGTPVSRLSVSNIRLLDATATPAPNSTVETS